ncbi:MAG: 50S ribosomal protein L2 [Planctomycetaceae bacterium]|jgi:large subunit ribosomal protein L2|nr:50S ribosomal protein L2 [Planctomycetaceae bacterium]
MGVKKYKPNNAARRNMSVSDFAELTKKSVPEKSLLIPKRRTNGRNNQGLITVRHRGGGHKKQFRLIDFRRNKDGVAAVVNSVQYDPNRTARIALLYYVDGEKRYIVAPEGLKEGAKLMSGSGAPPVVGNCLPLAEIPLGTDIHNIELQPNTGGVLCRTAGSKAVLVAKDIEAGWAQLNMPSGEIRRVPVNCRAVIGVVGNSDHMNIVIGKAGRSRWLGRRPHVRGTAMNPIDHPHGGGEGRTKGGRHPVTPTGKPTKGTSTRKKRKSTNRAILRRRKSRRYGILKLY